MNKKVAVAIALVVGVLWLLGRSRPDDHSTSTPLDHPSSSPSSSTVLSSAGTYSEIAPTTGSHTFAGDPCTADCSGHEAGYKWAEEHDIEDEDACDTAGETSNSPSFAAGCRAYVNGESPRESDVDDSNQTEID